MMQKKIRGKDSVNQEPDLKEPFTPNIIKAAIIEITEYSIVF